MNDFINFLVATGINVWGIVKWLYVVAFVLCLLFTVVVTRQIQLMSRTLESSIGPLIRGLGPLMMLVAGVGLVVSLILL